ncbi:MAG TPA: response regulator transcription factor [Clostridiaceae bacterium]|nr:response regulator transcription factor [Clostridiaceae bacterium]
MSNENIKVLVVEDEPSIRKFITINLVRNGFSVMEAESGESALEILNSFTPRVIVLDIMLPGMDGFEFCRRVRQEMPDTAIIMLTARTQDNDKIMGLELGADDYMVKPFNPLELIARIRTILRRMDGVVENSKRIRLGKFLLDLNAQKFFKDSVEINLTPTEFSILKMFMTNSGRALSRNELLNSVWGKNYFGDLKALDVYIRRLREKLEDNPSEPKYIETVWGYGYRWQHD